METLEQMAARARKSNRERERLEAARDAALAAIKTAEAELEAAHRRYAEAQRAVDDWQATS